MVVAATPIGSRVSSAANSGRAASTMPSPVFDAVAAVQTVQKRRPSGRGRSLAPVIGNH